MFEEQLVGGKTIDLNEELVALSKSHRDILITVSGIKHYFGSKPFAIGGIVHLVKEPGNEFDEYAIQVICEGTGKCGYVANSEKTVKEGTFSAELIYGGIEDVSRAEVLWVEEDFAVCMLENLNSFDLAFNWGVTLCSDGKVETALEIFRSLEENRTDVTLLQRIADCLFRLDENDEAMTYLERALKMEPNNPRSLFMKKIISEK